MASAGTPTSVNALPSGPGIAAKHVSTSEVSAIRQPPNLHCLLSRIELIVSRIREVSLYHAVVCYSTAHTYYCIVEYTAGKSISSEL